MLNCLNSNGIYGLLKTFQKKLTRKIIANQNPLLQTTWEGSLCLLIRCIWVRKSSVLHVRETGCRSLWGQTYSWLLVSHISIFQNKSSYLEGKSCLGQRFYPLLLLSRKLSRFIILRCPHRVKITPSSLTWNDSRSYKSRKQSGKSIVSTEFLVCWLTTRKSFQQVS